MQAIEFETTAKNHTIHLPDSIPDGVSLRVLVLLDETVAEPSKNGIKTLLAGIAEGLTEEDLARPRGFKPLTVSSAFGLVKTPITATLEEIEQGIIAGAVSGSD